MKKLMGSLAAKIAAIMLSFIAAVICAATVLSALVMIDAQFYTRTEDSLKRAALEGVAWDKIHDIANKYESGLIDLDYYAEIKNIYFSIKDSKSGEVIFNNYNGEKYLIKEIGTEIPIYSEVLYYDEYGNENYDEKQTDAIDVEVYVSEDIVNSERVRLMYWFIDFAYPLRYSVYIIGVMAVIAEALLLIFLYCAEGHRADGSVKLNHLDRAPFDLVTAAGIVIISLMAVLVSDIGYYGNTVGRILIIGLAITVCYFTALAYTLTFAARIKNGTLLKNNVIYKVCILLWRVLKKAGRGVKSLFESISLVKKAALIVGTALFMEMLVLIICLSTGSIFIAFWWMMVSAIIGIAVIYTAAVMKKIKQGGERIAAGDLQYKIDNSKMRGEFREFSESLNNINLGLQNAVNEKMKSEHFRTELITNVSHDIKTPLTSIINYVDLIKKEDPENENIKQYIEVLDRQSGRLKKLIEDLVEASKASTGNIAVNLSECEVGVLLSQTVGEFDERLSKSGLTAVLKQPDTPVKIMADGRHLWRVFDNLMSNICKYSQPDTRVYMDVRRSDGKAVITFRNISKYELNISGDELMERFVRGDSSRNTEGSGLGLSIAESLVALQNGQMKIDVDGDLFKVTLTFDAV